MALAPKFTYVGTGSPVWVAPLPDSDETVVCEELGIHFYDSSGKELESKRIETTELTAAAVSPCGKLAAVANQSDRTVSVWSLEEKAVKCALTRAEAPVLALAWAADSSRVAVMGAGGLARVLRADAAGAPLDLDVRSDVLSAAFDPRGELLATAAEDGAVRIFALASGELLKELPIMATGAANGGAALRLAWSPDGALLAVPGSRVQHSAVQLVARGSWEAESALADGHSTRALQAAFSPSGRLCATAGADDKCVVWDVATQTQVATADLGAPPADLAWASESGLLLGNADGRFGSVEVPEVSAEAPEDEDDEDAAEAAADAALEAEAEAALRGGSKLVESEAAEADAAAEAADAAADAVLADVAKEFDVDLGEGESKDEGEGSADMDIDPPIALEHAEQAEQTEMQPPFQPAAAHSQSSGRGFFAWNTVGVISTRAEEVYTSVEIDFHDATAHKAVRLTDHYGFTMGALSDTAAVFASPSVPPAGPGAKPVFATVYYHGVQDSGKWVHTLPEGEEVDAVAVGRGWAAAATTRHMVRLFMHGGLQETPFMLPGPVVCMCGWGPMLAVVFHAGAPFAGNQRLGYKLVNLETRTEAAAGSVGLSAGSTLSWIGFSDEGMLCVQDEEGLLLGLAPAAGAQWTPLLDVAAVRRAPLDRFWPVGLAQGKLLYVLLKGGDKEPVIFPRPILAAEDVALPLLPGADALEPVFARQLLDLHHTRWLAEQGGIALSQEALVGLQTALDQTTLKMVEAACRGDAPDRVGDLCAHLQLEKAHQIAVRLAGHYHHEDVAERVHAVMRARFAAGLPAAMVAPPAPAPSVGLPSGDGDDVLPSLRGDGSGAAAAAAPAAGGSILGKRSSPAPEEAEEEPVEAEEEEEEQPQQESRKPRNPFAKRTVTSPQKPQKRPKTVTEALNSIAEASPAKPALGRASSFMQRARGGR